MKKINLLSSTIFITCLFIYATAQATTLNALSKPAQPATAYIKLAGVSYIMDEHGGTIYESNDFGSLKANGGIDNPGAQTCTTINTTPLMCLGGRCNHRQTNTCGCLSSQFPFDGMPDDNLGTASICDDDNGQHYCYTKCETGYELENCDCVKKNCEGYNSNSYNIPGCQIVEKCPYEEKYKCTKCGEGGTGRVGNLADHYFGCHWTLNSNGTCSPSYTCVITHPFTSNPDETKGCLNVSVCVQCNVTADGTDFTTTTRYACDGCRNGFHQSDLGGQCDPDTCPDDYNLTDCPNHGACETCQAGSLEKFKLKECNPGFKKEGNTCIFEESM